jgi:hypothetical protein
MRTRFLPRRKIASASNNDGYLFKLLPAILTVMGLAIGVWQFTNQQAFNDKMEFKRRIWEKRMEAYTQIGDVVAKIVSDRDDAKFDTLYKSFNEMYWGKIPLFEDDSVELAMKDFKYQLKDKAEGIQDLFESKENPILSNSGYRLIKICQKSISKSWTELSK